MSPVAAAGRGVGIVGAAAAESGAPSKARPWAASCGTTSSSHGGQRKVYFGPSTVLPPTEAGVGAGVAGRGRAAAAAWRCLLLWPRICRPTSTEGLDDGAAGADATSLGAASAAAACAIARERRRFAVLVGRVCFSSRIM